MRILMAGSTGLIGQHLVRALQGRGDTVVRLVRPTSAKTSDNSSETIIWEPERGKVELARLDGFDVFVNLAGSSIAGRFTPARKQSIHNSRVASTSVLAQGMLRLKKRPRVFVSASAVGFYGNRGDDVLTEQDWPGTGFLADVCTAWEKSAQSAREFGARVVLPRLGVVLSPDGSILKKILPIFRLGLGGPIGDGRQYLSWIGLPDLISGLLFLIDHPTIDGPVNLTAPNPVTNSEFTTTLARQLRRPAVFPVPAPVLRLVYGEMADDLLLNSTRAVPEKLTAAGFRFTEPDLSTALTKALGKN